MDINTDKDVNAAKKTSVLSIVILNIIFFSFVAFDIGPMKMMTGLKEYTKDWEKIDVLIDDVSFEKDGSDTDDGETTYKFKMNRILKYTYKGEYYEVKNTKRYTSKSKNYSVALRTGYIDEYEYKVDPASPRSISMYYSDFSDAELETLLNVLAIIRRTVFIAIPVIIDIVVFVKYRRSRKNIFDDEAEKII